MSKFPGGHRGRVTPVPIPNTEVKPATADGTACVGVWESRSLPGLFHQARLNQRRAFLLYWRLVRAASMGSTGPGQSRLEDVAEQEFKAAQEKQAREQKGA